MFIKRAIRSAFYHAGIDVRRVRQANPSEERNRRRLESLLDSDRPIKLEIGAGARPGSDGWTTADLCDEADLILDISQPLPFPDGSVEIIYSEHVLEHFTYPDPLAKVLAECRRILKPGGVFSCAVPNARLYLEAYFRPEGFDLSRYCEFDTGLSYKTPIDYVNCIAFMAGHHKHLFDDENLLLVLGDTGFAEPRLREFDPSLDSEMRREGTIYAEASA